MVASFASQPNFMEFSATRSSSDTVSVRLCLFGDERWRDICASQPLFECVHLCLCVSLLPVFTATQMIVMQL